MRREARITSKGQVTIPRDIRRAMRAEKGDVLVFETDERGVHVRLLPSGDVFEEYEGAWREGEGKSVEEINAWLREFRGHDI